MNSEMVQTSYAYSKVVSMSLEEAIEHVTEELKKERHRGIEKGRIWYSDKNRC
jgi:hypothetical protein